MLNIDNVYTDKEILINRRTWIRYLKNPNTMKAHGVLEQPDISGARCCLGHACFILGAEVFIDKADNVRFDGQTLYPGDRIITALGLKTNTGAFANSVEIIVNDVNFGHHASLADLNDGSKITPQEIGEWLETVIMGGENTPFTAISID